MPVYRLVVNLAARYEGESRASPFVNMTHWAECDDDDAAMLCARRLREHMFPGLPTTNYMGVLWTCHRSDANVHWIDVEEWRDGERFRAVGRHRFPVRTLPSVSHGFGDIPVISDLGEFVWPLASTSLAVVVELTSSNGQTRRSYVGPISPVVIKLGLTIPIVGTLFSILVPPVPEALPDPILPALINTGQPGVEYDVEHWPTTWAAAIAQWTRGIDGAYEDAGQAVTYEGGVTSPIVSARASDLPARVKSRSRRGVWVS